MRTIEFVVAWGIGGVGRGIFFAGAILTGFGLFTGVCFFTALSGEGVGDIRGLFPRAGMFSYLVTVVLVAMQEIYRPSRNELFFSTKSLERDCG